MKILFVESPNLRTDKLGIMYISALLKQRGHQTALVYGNDSNIDDTVSSSDWDFIFYSVMTGDHRWLVDKNRELKRKYPGKFISVMGGPHFTFFPEEGLTDYSVDIVVIGPAENVIDDILTKITNRLLIGLIPDIQDLPFPDRSIQYRYDQFGKYPMKRFIACRDCPNSCKYCFNHIYHKIMHHCKDKFYQSRTPQQMIDEIIEVKKEWGLELAYFNDDDLARDEEWISAFCHLMQKVGISFCGSARANSLLQKDMIELLAKSGCTFMNIALESAVPSTQKFLRRGNVDNDQIIKACRTCENKGIKVRLQNMIGLPVEDPLEDALRTLEFNQDVGVTDSWAAIFQPFPKTELWQYCIDNGLIDEKSECGTFYDSSPLKIENKMEINNLHKWWHLAVKHKIPIGAVRELIKIPIVPEQAKVMQDIRWKEGAKVLYGK